MVVAQQSSPDPKGSFLESFSFNEPTWSQLNRKMWAAVVWPLNCDCNHDGVCDNCNAGFKTNKCLFVSPCLLGVAAWRRLLCVCVSSDVLSVLQTPPVVRKTASLLSNVPSRSVSKSILHRHKDNVASASSSVSRLTWDGQFILTEACVNAMACR